MISDLCDENKQLTEMYEDIRDSPLAAEMKKDYEDRLDEWNEKYDDLNADYQQLEDDNRALRSDIDALQRE